MLKDLIGTVIHFVSDYGISCIGGEEDTISWSLDLRVVLPSKPTPAPCQRSKEERSSFYEPVRREDSDLHQQRNTNYQR